MNSNQLEIVLVEDSLSDARLTMMALRSGNIANEVIHLKDGEEALDYFFCKGKYANRKVVNPVGLILLDLKMPKLNGIEVIQQLKSNDQTRFIPIAVFTSSQEDPDMKECYRLGVNSYIVKPLDFEQFAKTVREVGLYWLVTNSRPSS
jgi:two-component system response regulator